MNSDWYSIISLAIKCVTIFCILFVFRSPLSIFITKISSLSFKKKNGDAVTQIGIHTELNADKIECQVIEQSETLLKSVDSGPEDKETDESNNIVKLYELYSKGSTSEAEHVYNNALGLLHSQEDLFEIKLSNEYFRYTFGIEKSLEKLKLLAAEYKNDIKKYIRLNTLIARSLIKYSNYNEAEKLLDELLPLSNDYDIIHPVLFCISDIIKSRDGAINAINYLLSIEDKFEGSGYKYNLYKAIYSLSKEIDNKHFASIALSRALLFQPNNTDDLFNAAYSSDNNLFSLFYYSRLRTIEQSNSFALNNLAVVYSKLNLKVNSINLYKEASDLGNTLSMSNIASSFIESGFIDNAKVILNEALTKSDVHKNVHFYLSKIDDKIEEENKTITKLLIVAEKYTIFISKHAKYYFQNLDEVDIYSEYIADNGDSLKIEKTEYDYSYVYYYEKTVSFKTFVKIPYRATEATLTKESTSYTTDDKRQCTMVFIDNTTVALFVIINNENTKELILNKKTL